MSMMKNVVGCLAVAAMLVVVAEAATTYTVGDADAWSSGVDYKAWLSSKSFKVGDSLLFTYLPNHDVLEVSKADYDSCTSTNPISSDKSGSTTIALTTAGKRYFICGSEGHCGQGMLVEIDTSASSTSPPPAATPPPASTPETSPPVSSPAPTISSPTSPTASPPASTTPKASPSPPPPSVTKVAPTPSPSSGHKISYGACFAFVLILIAAI